LIAVASFGFAATVGKAAADAAGYRFHRDCLSCLLEE